MGAEPSAPIQTASGRMPVTRLAASFALLETPGVSGALHRSFASLWRAVLAEEFHEAARGQIGD